MKRSSGALSIAACALALSAVSCDTDSGGGPLVPAGFAVPTPKALLQSRAVDRNALEVAVTLGGVEQAVSVGGNGERRVAVTLRRGETTPLEITWLDRSSGRALPLFALSTTVGPVSTNAAVEVDGEYVLPDADGDGDSNLVELEAGTNPFPEPGEAPSTAELGAGSASIVRLDPALAPPVIDGFYDQSGVWNGARFVNVDGRLLHIDNLIVDDGAEAADGEPMYRWFAMHDDAFLYLYVFFEGARDDGGAAPRDIAEYTPFNDSSRFFEDDGLNLFFDGDESRRPTLDGVDDLYLHIPQVTPSDDSGSGVVARRPFALDTGVESLEADGFEYESCVCPTGNSGWEMRIPLSGIGVTIGRPFGLEIQIDQDLDGEGREARWGWANPSIAERGGDYRFESPRFNGRAVLSGQVKVRE